MGIRLSSIGRLGLVCGLCAGWFTSVLPAQDARGKKYALLVGVEVYNPEIFTRLRFAEDDALELGRALAELGFDVVTMTSQADIPARRPNTSDKILTQLQQRLKGLAAEDTVVISFSGHGLQFKNDPPGTDGAKEIYFCPEEADPQQRRTLVPMSQVHTLLTECRAGRKLLIVDACRNEILSALGKTARQVELEPVGLIPRTVPQGLLALYSCSSRETSYEHPELAHGVFCYHVLKYLRGQAAPQFYPQGELRIDDLVYFAKRETRDYVLAKLSADQYPELVGRTSDWSLGRTGLGKELTNSIGMKLVLIPAGEFQMGSPGSELGSDGKHEADESPQHRVRITKPFYLGQYEVTRGQFAQFVAAQGYQTEAERDGKGGYGTDANGNWSQKPEYTWKNPGFTQDDSHPVVNVSWNDAQAFCQWLSGKEGKKYRLPTEAEWEYACRAGTTSTYQHGSDPEGLAQVGNVADGTAKAKFTGWTTIKARDGYVYTSPVGQFRANVFGLFDMHGNVWEWCQDWYDGDYYAGSPVDDPQGPASGSYRVDRGGSWFNSAARCRSAYRYWDSPGGRSGSLGFRLALSPSGQ